MTVPKGKADFPKEQWTSLMERPKFLEKHMFQNFWQSQSSHYIYIYRLPTYRWKGFEENYNFVVENTSIRIKMQKLWSYKVSNKFAFKKNMI
jgi:hypothetical protein